MPHKKYLLCAILVLAALPSILAIDCRAQDRLDHSCTVDAAGSFVLPKGDDGRNFDAVGWGVRAGGGFAVWRSTSHRGLGVYIAANFMYERSKATGEALAQAKTTNSKQLANATSAHGAFTAVTIDPTVRYAFTRRFGVYASGGFGWLRRGIGFNSANPGTLLNPNGASLDRQASNSGVFDFGAGVNFRPRKSHGFAIFAECRVYRGVAINSTSALVPISAGIRW
jgi:hypothetical protein